MNPDPDADVTFQFNQIQLLSKEVDDDDVTFGFNKVIANDESESLKLSPEKLPENDDVDHDGENNSVSQRLVLENDDVEDEDDDVTFNVNQVQIDSKPQQFTPENDDVDNKEADVEGEVDDVTFNISQVQIDSKLPENDDVDDGDDDVTFGSSQAQINANEYGDVDDEDDDVTFGSSQVQINTNEEADVADEEADVEDEGDDVDDEEDDDVEGEEFTFMCTNSDNSITELTEKTVFPLFDQSLLYNNEDGKRINDIHVNNVFIESPRRATSSLSTSSSTTLTAITDSNEMNIKSNSTGFSKLWRFRDNNNMNRSNSDGRDAFVFLNPKTEGKIERKTEGKGKGKEEEKVVVKKKVKKANVSAHEVYLKKAKGGGDEEKRKSYLPYRPGLMGFFTNVNGGLSKNVHPF